MDRKPISRQLIERVRQEYALPWYGIHGVSHWARVRNNGLVLARLYGVNPDVVELFAFLHDAKRRDDGRDWEHGQRAAKLVQALRGSLVALADQDFESLVFACEHHTEGLTKANVTIQTCWDADRLDLGRVGIKPDARYLCTPAARDQSMIEWAFLQSRQTKPGRARLA